MCRRGGGVHDALRVLVIIGHTLTHGSLARARLLGTPMGVWQGGIATEDSTSLPLKSDRRWSLLRAPSEPFGLHVHVYFVRLYSAEWFYVYTPPSFAPPNAPPRSTGGPRASRNGRRGVRVLYPEMWSNDVDNHGGLVRFKMSIFEEGVVSILRMIRTECRAGPGRVLHFRHDAGRNPKNNAARTSGKRSRECFFHIGACRCCGAAWS